MVRKALLTLCLLGLLLSAAALLVPPGAFCLTCRTAFGPEKPRLILRQGLVWRAQDPHFGGMSGLEVTQNGHLLLSLSDRGHLFETKISRDPTDGTITALDLTRITTLLTRKGRPLSPFRQDAEDLAEGPQGDLFVAFEGLSRIAKYPRHPADPQQGHIAKDLNIWDRFEARFGNNGFEALIAFPDSDLLVIAEAANAEIDVGTGAPAFLYRKGHWERVSDVPTSAGFSVSSADIGPDGKLWILERQLGWAGFMTRIRTFEIHKTEAQVTLGPPETLLQGYLGPRDNFEGLSVWQTNNGCTIATLIADDGFSRLQRTALTEFFLSDPQSEQRCDL